MLTNFDIFSHPILKITASALFFVSAYILAIFGLNVYIALFRNYEYVQYLLESNDNEDDILYDYIIVGCGTAGSLIAHHLSIQKNVKYLVLEAGGQGGPLLNPPALGPLLHNTFHDWQYQTVPQKYACQAMKGKVCKLASGKIVGGSAKLNNMIHVRGYTDEIVESWFGEKYSYYQMHQLVTNLEYYDLPVQKLKYKTQLSSSVLEAAKKLGYTVSNLNNMTKTGFMETVVNQRHGGRWTTSHAFLKHLFPNGKLKTHSTAMKILIEPITKTAKGVVYERYGRTFHVFAKKGVILTSGAIGTPKLLLLSGIGPKKHLEDLNIPLIKDLPVGENLLDHVTTGLDLILVENPLKLNIKKLISPISAFNYFVHGNGPWTASGCEVIGIVNTCDNNPEESNTLPNLQLMVLPFGITSDYGVSLPKTVGLRTDIWKQYFQKITLKNTISILPVVLHPKSVGTVKLRSKDPNDMPLIDPNYLSNPADAEVLLSGIDLIKQLLNTEAMSKLGANLNPDPFPGCRHLPFDTREYWLCYVSHFTLTSYHPAGTCRLGDPLNSTSVVDYNFEVIGVNNLFIADASVFPTLPSGNINTAVAIIANLFVNTILQM